LPFVHVDLRWSLAESRAHVTLVAGARLGPAAVRPIAEALMVTHPEVAGVGLRSAGEGPVPRALTGATVSVAGRPHLEETIGRARFRLSPGAFFQVDPAAAARVHDVVREWLADPQAGPAAHLCDLYAGVGAFAIALADTAERTTAVESVAAATDDAAASADLSGVRVRVVRSPVERFLGGIGPDPPFGRGDGRSRGVGHDPPDRVVLDPPRRGVPLGVLRALGAVAPVRLAYVSCDPETLARDLDALVPHGLVAGAVAPVDMFSLTDEVEAVALIGRRERPWQPVVHHAGSDVVAAEKPAVLPTHPQGPGEASLRDAVRAATGLRDLEPAHRLDVGTSGPVLFARGEALRALGRAFETGAVDKEYLALVRGVPRRAGTIRIAAEGGRRGAPEATRYRREDVVGGYGLLRVSPGTGRRHQIRRHLQRIGHPVLGDDRYGDPRANRFLADTCALARPFLHLAAVAFTTEDGSRRRIESPLPPELELVLDRLRRLRGDFPPRDDGQG
jgi:23S rRNA-/tRNA-specific pseudouridylate synthase